MARRISRQETNRDERFRVQYGNIHLFEAPTQRVESRSHVETAQLLVMLSGGYRAAWQCAGRNGQVAATAGHVVYWPDGTRRVESNDPRRPMRCLCVYFRWLDPIPDLPVLVRDRKGTIRQLAESMLLAKDFPLPWQQAMWNGYLAAMLAEYLRMAGPVSDDLAERIGLYVESHLRKPIYLEDMARAVGLEKSYFCRRYKTVTGRSPMNEVQRLRSEHAAGVIRSNARLTLKDVAARVGIGDEHQLSKLLKKHMSMTAKELRGARP